jgi:hypothetical protein
MLVLGRDLKNRFLRVCVMLGLSLSMLRLRLSAQVARGVAYRNGCLSIQLGFR